MISDEDKEKVRQATDIVALVGETVDLKQRGQEFWGCCPFHQEKSPSFKVNPGTGLWHCFGCGTGGDVFSYVQKRENLDFPDAIRYLADKAGVELSEERSAYRGPKRARLLACLAEAEAYYTTMLMRGRGEGPDEARHYFASRGFGSDVCHRWQLGYAPGNGKLVAHLKSAGYKDMEMTGADLARERRGTLQDRFFGRVMFPIHDEQGRPIAFGARILQAKKAEGVAKYINTGDTAVFNKRKHLFALDKAKDAISSTRTAIVCEGYTDVIALHEAGYTNAVAALGTAFSEDHVKLLQRFHAKRIICMFDGDAAGQRAAERAVQYVGTAEAEFLCVVLPDNQDPMEFLASHPSQEMQAELDRAVPLIDFVFRKRLEDFDLSIPGVRVKAAENLAELLVPYAHSILLERYARQLAAAVDTDPAKIEDMVKRKAAKRGGSAGRQTAGRAGQEQIPTYDGPSYDDFDYAADDGGYPVAPADYPAASSFLSPDEVRQLDAEEELLAMIAKHPAAVRPFADRIASFSWADPRHQAIAWAMLATPEDATPMDVVTAASAASPDAAQILGGGRVASSEGMTEDRKMAFLVDAADLYSTRKQVRDIRSKLAMDNNAAPDIAKELIEEATKLQIRERELSDRLSAYTDRS